MKGKSKIYTLALSLLISTILLKTGYRPSCLEKIALENSSHKIEKANNEKPIVDSASSEFFSGGNTSSPLPPKKIRRAKIKNSRATTTTTTYYRNTTIPPSRATTYESPTPPEKF